MFDRDFSRAKINKRKIASISQRSSKYVVVCSFVLVERSRVKENCFDLSFSDPRHEKTPLKRV